MTQEEKQLLLKDLCARLPYGVKVSILGGGAMELQACIHSSTIGWYFDIKDAPTDFALDEIKPYLRPMSSMTEEEYKEFSKISGLWKKEEGNYFSNHLSELGNSIITERVMVRTIDWLNSHYFDYRGLIPMGLALVAPKDMYKNE